MLVAALLAGGPAATGRAAPAGERVSFDEDLARADDRAAYERSLRAMVADARARVVAALGMEPAAATEVRVHSRAGFARLFGAAAAGEEAARYEGDVVHVNGGARLDDRLAGVLVHEMTHAALDAGGRARRLPRWLDEGLAERLSWERRGLPAPAPNQAAELRQALAARTLLPLPREGTLDASGYLRSWAAVVFLERTFGRERVLGVVRSTLDGEPFESALRKGTGLSTDDLERAFAAWVKGL